MFVDCFCSWSLFIIFRLRWKKLLVTPNLMLTARTTFGILERLVFPTRLVLLRCNLCCSWKIDSTTCSSGKDKGTKDQRRLCSNWQTYCFFGCKGTFFWILLVFIVNVLSNSFRFQCLLLQQRLHSKEDNRYKVQSQLHSLLLLFLRPLQLLQVMQSSAVCFVLTHRSQEPFKQQRERIQILQLLLWIQRNRSPTSSQFQIHFHCCDGMTLRWVQT